MTYSDLDPICSVYIEEDGKTVIDAIHCSSIRKVRYVPEPCHLLIWISDEENKTRKYLLSDADTERLIHLVQDHDRSYNRPHAPANVPLEFLSLIRNGQTLTIVATQM